MKNLLNFRVLAPNFPRSGNKSSMHKGKFLPRILLGNCLEIASNLIKLLPGLLILNAKPRILVHI